MQALHTDLGTILMKQETFHKLSTKENCIPLYLPTDNTAKY